jgi:hypothetical protein
MDQIAPEYADVPAARLLDVARDVPDNDRLVMLIAGTTIEGEDIVKTVAVQFGAKGADGRKRLTDAGLTVVPMGDQVQISQVKFGSRAKKAGFEQGWAVKTLKVPTDRPSAHWFYVPALLLAGLVWWAQGRRMRALPATA